MRGLDDLEAGILQDVDEGHPDKGFVFDNENEGRGLDCGLGMPDGRESNGRRS